MTSIHWLAWISIGLAVIFLADRIGGNFTLFYWVGLAFLVVGIAKVIHRFVFTPRPEKKETKVAPKSQVATAVVRCPRCMTLAHASDNYCRVCGTPLRHR